MDITRPVTYRGLTLTGASGGPGGNEPIEGIRLTRADLSNVSVHGYVEKRSLDDGYDASDVFIGMRNITLQGEVFAKTKASLFDILDAMRLKFTPTDAYREDPASQGYLPLAFSQPTLHTVHWPEGFVDRVVYARPTGQPTYAIEFLSIGGSPDDGYSVPFQVGLQAKDPRMYGPDPVLEPMVGTSGSGTLQNRGSYPAPLQFIVAIGGEVTGEATFAFVGMGTNMTVTVPPGTVDRQVNIDSVKKVATLVIDKVETLRMDLIEFTAGTTWPKVPPTQEGDSPAGYEWNSNLALDEGARMWFREAWV